MALAVSLAAAARRALLHSGSRQALRMPASLGSSVTVESSPPAPRFSFSSSSASAAPSPLPRPPPQPASAAATATPQAVAASPPATNLAARAALSVDPAVLAKARRLSLPVGVAAGLFGSVVGVGGGTLIVPFFSSTCPAIPQRLLSGTSLAAVLATAAAATPAYVSAGAVDAAAAAAVGGAALLAVRAGTGAALAARPRALRTALGAFLLVAAVLVPARTALLTLRGGDEEGEEIAAVEGEVGSVSAAAAATAAAVSSATSSSSSFSSLLDAPGRTAALLATGGAAGFASGLLGIGGGILVTPALALLGGLRSARAGDGGGGESAAAAAAAAATTTTTTTATTSTAAKATKPRTTDRDDFRSAQAIVVGTSLAAMAPPAAAALAGHAAAKNVDWRIGLGLAAGSLLGSLLGSRSAVSAPPGYLEAAFSVAMVGLGLNALKVAKRI